MRIAFLHTWSSKRRGLTFFALLSSLGAWASPYNPSPFTTDNNGTVITIQQLGDEHYSYTQTTDGYLIEQSSDGTYYYLDQSANITSIKVADPDQRTATDLRFLNGIDQQKCISAHRNAHPLKNMPPAVEAEETRAVWVPSIENPNTNLPREMRMPSGHPHVFGTNRFPVILVAGTAYANSDSTEFSNRLNQEGYHGAGHYGSVRDYYIDQSNGLFVPSYDVYVVNVNMRLSDYAGNEGAVIQAAIASLRNKYPYFNASIYDSDNDGDIDAFGILYAGTQQQNNNLGGFAYELQWNKEGKQSVGGKKFNRYFMLWQNNDSRNLLDIGHIIHEFSHTMGLKDHYSVRNNPSSFTTQYPGVHSWDVMAGGMFYNGGGTPCGYSAFEKEFMGWITTKPLVASDKTIALGDFASTDLAYKLAVTTDEYFLLENRQLTGWDQCLPNHGMLIWHIDYDPTSWNNDVLNDTEDHQRIDIVEAGNLKVTSYADGLTTTHLRDDPYPGTQNVTSFSRFISWNGSDLGIKLYQITEANNTIYFTTDPNVKLDTNIIPEGGAEPARRDTLYFDYQVELKVSDSYAGVAFDLSDLLDSLGIGGNVQSLYANGDLKIYGVNADGSFQKGSTAIDPGHWFDASGNVSAYAQGYVYSELKLVEKRDTIGHYPGRVSVGDVYTVSQALEYGNRVAQYAIKVTIVDTKSGDNNVVVTPVVMAVVDRHLQINGMDDGKKLLKIYNLNGQLLSAMSVVGADESVPLHNMGATNLIVVLESDGKQPLTKKIFVK